MGHNLLKTVGIAAILSMPTTAFGDEVSSGNGVTPNVSTTDVVQAVTGNSVGVSRLFRDKRGVRVEIVTSGLDIDAVYTVWWVIFNDPNACATTPCGPADAMNPATIPGVMWADGFHASSAGIGSMTASLLENDVSGEQAPFAANTLQNAAKAEIHMVLKSHGLPAANIADIFRQVTTSEGGPACMACADTHFAIHQPQ
jgi:hypothetical protein